MNSGGAGQYFQLPTMNLGRMSAGSGFSICVWFVFDVLGRWSRVFDMGCGSANKNILLTQSGESNILTLHVWNFSNIAVEQQLDSPISITTGVWRHVCIVNQGRSWKLYDNGALSAFASLTFDIQPVNLTSNYLGRSNWGSDYLFQGKIGEFRVYNKSLSGSEVEGIYTLRGMIRLNLRCAK
jgi:hypothetical protein